MSYNLVVLTDDLGKLTYANDVLGFDGNSKVTSVPVPVISGNPIRVDFYQKEIVSVSKQYLLDTSNGSVGFLVRRQNLALEVFIYDSTQQIVLTQSSNLVDGWNTVIITEPIVGGGYDVDLNGVVVHQPLYNGSFFSGSSNMIVGASVDDAEEFTGLISRVSIGDEIIYNTNGQFGNASLLDSSGNNNDGTLSDINMWWKTKFGKPVDQVFANATLYNNQLPVTPVEFQKVIDIGPPTGDIFYDPYGVEDLTVTIQTNLAKYNLKSNGLSNKIALEN